jgi:hypothetical protein
LLAFYYGDYEIHAKHGVRTSLVHRLYAADDSRDVLLHLKVDKKEKPKPFVPGDPSNGNMFVVFGVAGLTKNGVQSVTSFVWPTTCS